MLTALQSDTREDLKALLAGYGTALTYEPTAADDTDAGHRARAGESAAESLNDAIEVRRRRRCATPRSSTRRCSATEPHDLSQADRRPRRRHRRAGPQRGRSSRTSSRTSTRRWRRSPPRTRTCSATIRLLPRDAARPPTARSTSLNAAFPTTRAFARGDPPRRARDAGDDRRGLPWIAQTRSSLVPDGARRPGRGAAADDRPRWPRSIDDVDRPAARRPTCSSSASDERDPADRRHQDRGRRRSARATENYKEFWYTMVGLAGEGQNFDGNGMYVRFQPGGGDQTISTGKVGGSAGDPLFGNVVAKPLGTRPKYPGVRPAVQAGLSRATSRRSRTSTAPRPARPTNSQPRPATEGVRPSRPRRRSPQGEHAQGALHRRPERLGQHRDRLAPEPVPGWSGR